jgi:epoxyqueuosine reductase
MARDLDGNTMETHLAEKLDERGYHGRVVSLRHLSELRDEIQTRCVDGSLDQTFYDECLSEFDFNPPEEMPDARSLIIAAVRQAQIRFTFTWNDAQVELMVPPTYLHWQRTNRQVGDTLAEILRPAGYRVAEASVPKKLLAVRSGLAVYGRNNISYIDGMGSFHRLAAFYSDLPCDTDNWQEPRMMERCQACTVCLNHCPTGAITDQRFLLQAERCIVFHNEHPTDVPFPRWLDSSWHNCLVGCMLCQTTCPENRDFLESVEDGAAFSSEETTLLLEGRPPDQLPPRTVEKLKQSDLIDLLDVLPRNLRVLLDKLKNA